MNKPFISVTLAALFSENLTALELSEDTQHYSAEPSIETKPTSGELYKDYHLYSSELSPDTQFNSDLYNSSRVVDKNSELSFNPKCKYRVIVRTKDATKNLMSLSDPIMQLL
ncbi:hypothetical protein [Endozoicomonas arenosclerae]|uniref:hypothetical protein n=1 Tax=Endozoicomonas arenosclerae TaxID=1633495 RepID=UPI000ACB7747|nr:hypothetical protein [Endozoicomonas arenosclerae]